MGQNRYSNKLKQGYREKVSSKVTLMGQTATQVGWGRVGWVGVGWAGVGWG